MKFLQLGVYRVKDEITKCSNQQLFNEADYDVKNNAHRGECHGLQPPRESSSHHTKAEFNDRCNILSKYF